MSTIQKKRNLLINCDLDWVADKADFRRNLEQVFDTVTVLGQSAELDGNDLSQVTHWITNPAPRYSITEGLVMRLVPNLEVIGSPSTGVTHIDPALFQKGLQVFCLQDIAKSDLNRITASSEFTLLAFLSIVRKAKVIHGADLTLWRDDLRPFRGRQVQGMTVLIFGFGRIGSNLGRYLTAMGVTVLYYEPDITKHDPDFSFIEKEQINTVLAQVDATFLCFHWSPENSNFIGCAQLDALRDDAFLVNSSRGENIDEDYLCDLIEGGKFSGVALDVLCCEQSVALKKSRVLALERHTDRLFVSPHIAGSSTDSERLAFSFIFDLVNEAETGT